MERKPNHAPLDETAKRAHIHLSLYLSDALAAEALDAVALLSAGEVSDAGTDAATESRPDHHWPDQFSDTGPDGDEE